MESRVRADSNEIPMVVDHQDQDFDEETEYNAIDSTQKMQTMPLQMMIMTSTKTIVAQPYTRKAIRSTHAI